MQSFTRVLCQTEGAVFGQACQDAAVPWWPAQNNTTPIYTLICFTMTDNNPYSSFLKQRQTPKQASKSRILSSAARWLAARSASGRQCSHLPASAAQRWPSLCRPTRPS